jgi:hypothetical protein
LRRGNPSDDDVFSSVGGLELGQEADGQTDRQPCAASPAAAASSLMGPMIGDLPFGDAPTRTLLVSNVEADVDDAELRTLFEVPASLPAVASIRRQS